MEELLTQVEEVYTKIFELGIVVPQKEKQNISSKILNYIQTLQHDKQQHVSEGIIKATNKRVRGYIQKQILPQFQSDCNSEEKIEKFLYLQKMYIKQIKSIIPTIYQTAHCLQQESIPQFFNNLFDNIFVDELQSFFENTLFNCAIDLIEKASKSKDENYIYQISEKLKQFGDTMTQLYKSTEEALTFKIETTFKQKIYDYYEELYQNYHKNWKVHLLTQQYLEEVSNQKVINSKILQFNDKTILQQVNKILNSHLLTQYKSQLLNVIGGDNFEGYLINYHSDPDRYSKVLTQIGDLYGSLEDHYDQLTNTFKNLIVKEGQNIMRQKNKQIVENNQDQKFSDPKFIQSFYDLYQKYFQLIERCFSLKSDFIMALNNAFETFINCPIGNHEFADYLVVYIGEQIEYLRTQSKIVAIQSYEHIIRLFVFINQKQRFIKLYKIYLAQRLIRYQRQVDNKKNKAACLIESKVVEEMEKKCGTQDLESLKIMIDDYSKIEIENYKKQDINGISLFIQKPIILCKQFWPEIDEIQINLPYELIQQQKQEIASQHSQKTLIWLDIISSVEVQTDKQITLNISVPQCAILFLYQFDNIPLDLQTISNRTNLHLSYVTQNCKIMKDFKILEEQIKDNTIYYLYNENSTKKKGGKQQKKITTDTYFQTVQIEQVVSIQDKDLAIEAAIVKLMKKNKEMQFSDLVIQVQGHMKTHQNIEISFSQIKLMIEKLQRNEYLERDSSNIQLIKYK